MAAGFRYALRIGTVLNWRVSHPSIKARVPNITPGGQPGFWTEEQFMTAIREGQTPGGHPLDPKLMPWKTYRNLTGDELQAIWLYLQSRPKLPTNS